MVKSTAIQKLKILKLTWDFRDGLIEVEGKILKDVNNKIDYEELLDLLEGLQDDMESLMNGVEKIERNG
jgi:hypothetical protein